MAAPTGMDDDRLDWHLWNWSAWHSRRFGEFRRLWYPARASSGMGRSHGSDFDGMVAVADTRCARAVEAALADCSPAERCSVHHIHLEAVYRLREPLQDCYALARKRIRDHLTRAGIV